jgi:hypothetical protein
MQKIGLLVAAVLLCTCLAAQDVEYKKGTILVDGNEYATVEVKKQNLGLTKSFEVFNMAGQKIIIAVVATEFESDRNDNSFLFYRLTFLTAGQVGIFKIPSLSQEKGFAKLIGNSGILVKDTVNSNRLMEFIASKSVTPSIAVNYTPVVRNLAWPVSLTKDKNVEQDNKIIGNFKPVGSSGNMDFYEFALPSGVIIAKVSFTGGNNAQNMELFTAKDNYRRVVPMPLNEKIIVADASIDRNQLMLRRIAKWLVDNRYL